MNDHQLKEHLNNVGRRHLSKLFLEELTAGEWPRYVYIILTCFLLVRLENTRRQEARF